MASKVPMNLVMRVLQSRDLVQRGVRNAVRKRLTSRLDYYFGNGHSEPPVQIDIKVIDACNLRCKMCPQWGDTGYNFDRILSQQMPLNVYKRLVDDVADLEPWLYIWGGEPFLYADLLPFLSYVKDRGLTASVVTNGTRLDGHIPRLVEIGLDILLFSVDGPRDTHDNIRGYKGAFEKTVAAIQAIQAEKRRRRSVKPYIVMVCVVTADNQHNFEEVFELGERLGIDLMLSVLAWHQTAESGARHTLILEKELGVTPWAWRGFLGSANGIDPEIVRQSIQRIKARKWPFHYMFHPRIPDEAIDAFFQEHGNTLGYSNCTAPWVMAEVAPNGDVVTCRDYPDVVVGNIKEQSILEAWNGPRMVQFRRLLTKHNGVLPICTRCHGLMGC